MIVGSVIDVNDATIYQVPYRIVKMRNANSYLYNGIFSKTGWNVFNNPSTGVYNSKNGGGLDYLRHPGILKDMAGGLGWTSNPRDMFSDSVENSGAWSTLNVRPCTSQDPYCVSSLYYADDIDALFNNVRKVYVFGEIYKDGDLGVHNIHQNQGNRGNDYVSSGGVYQDGGVIFEYNNGDRKLLMVKFGDYKKNGTLVKNQLDFSYSNDFFTKSYNDKNQVQTRFVQTGDGAKYHTEKYALESFRDASSEYKLGPYYAEQIEVMAYIREDGCDSFTDLDIYMGDNENILPSSSSSYYTYARNGGCYNEYLRASSDLWKKLDSSSPNQFYFFINQYSTSFNYDAKPVNVIVRYK